VRTSYVYRTKYFALLAKINRYKVPTGIEPYLKISVSNRSQVLKMSSVTKKIATQMSELYRGIIGDSLERLKKSNILTQDDIVAI
jgi:hypothetical protein